MLRLNNVSKNFGGLPALSNVSVEVPEGKLTALIGPNGAGKSTLINCITRRHSAIGGRDPLPR